MKKQKFITTMLVLSLFTLNGQGLTALAIEESTPPKVETAENQEEKTDSSQEISEGEPSESQVTSSTDEPTNVVEESTATSESPVKEEPVVVPEEIKTQVTDEGKVKLPPKETEQTKGNKYEGYTVKSTNRVIVIWDEEGNVVPLTAELIEAFYSLLVDYLDYYRSLETDFTPESFVIFEAAVLNFRQQHMAYLDGVIDGTAYVASYTAATTALENMVVKEERTITPAQVLVLKNLLTQIDAMNLYDVDGNITNDTYAPWSIYRLMEAYSSAEGFINYLESEEGIVTVSEYEEVLNDLHAGLNGLTAKVVKLTTKTVNFTVNQVGSMDQPLLATQKITTVDGEFEIRLYEEVGSPDSDRVRLDIYLNNLLIDQQWIDEEGYEVTADDLSYGYNSNKSPAAPMINISTNLIINLDLQRDTLIKNVALHLTRENTSKNPIVYSFGGDQDTYIEAYYEVYTYTDEEIIELAEMFDMSIEEVQATIPNNQETIIFYDYYYANGALEFSESIYPDESVFLMTKVGSELGRAEVNFSIDSDIKPFEPTEYELNLTVLRGAIKLADAKIEADYTVDSWKPFAETLSEAKEFSIVAESMYKKTRLSIPPILQSDVDTMTLNLVTATTNLVLKPINAPITNDKPKKAIVPTSVKKSSTLPKTGEIIKNFAPIGIVLIIVAFFLWKNKKKFIK